MKKRTKITLVLYVFISIILFLAIVIKFKSDVKKLKDSDITIVYNQEEFNEALEKDGQIYARGEIHGSLDLEDIPFDKLEFKGPDKARKIHEFKMGMKEDYIYLKLSSVDVRVTTQKVEVEGEHEDATVYEYEDRIMLDYYANMDYGVDEFEFYGYEFPMNESLANSLSSSYIKPDIEYRKKEHIIWAEYLKDGTPIWMDLEVVDGKIKTDKINIHDVKSDFNNVAEEVSNEGSTSLVEILIGVIIFMAMLFGLTILIQRKLFD